MDIFLRIESIEFSDKLDAEHKIMSLKKKLKELNGHLLRCKMSQKKNFFFEKITGRGLAKPRDAPAAGH